MNKYIMMFVAAIALVSCSDDVLETPSSPVKAGAEVQFGLSLESTRTIYGSEETTDDGKTVFPIYWVDGDKVQIYSPECLQGRNAAEYKVSVATAIQAYADSLTPTGDTGIQWGNDDTKKANFYSFYPSGAYHLDPTDNTQITGVNISAVQTIEYRGTDDDDNDIIKSDMEDCLMYASAENVDYGATVNLQYKPITTVLMLKLSVDSNSAENFNVSKISLTAPSGIVGTFNVDLETGKFVKFADETGIKNVVTNIIDPATGGFYTITKGSSFEVPIFIAPRPDVKLEGWKIEVIANNKTYTKTIQEGEITYGNGNTGLVAGKIHRITLPTLATEKETEWDVANWMKNIPRNVYLSEVSIPGTWNSLNPDFQTDLTIDAQYKNGVRAFHLDTRWQREATGVSWSGIEYKYTLGVANGGSTSGGSTSKYDNDSPVFKTCLEQVINNLKSDEYMVLVCSFAQNSADATGTNGKWYSEISAICNEYTKVYDAKKLTPDTVVGDVLNSVIVLVNMPSDISATTVLPTDSKCLFTYMPSELSQGHFDGTDDNQDALWFYESSSSAKDSKIDIYNNQAQITSSRIENNVNVGYTTSSRGYAPSVAERTAVLDKIVTWSKSNYGTDNYQHDKWIYLGLGGYQSSANDAATVSGSYATIENIYNPWINAKVAEMGTTVNDVKIPFYPVGIVLMNNKKGSNYTTGSGDTAVDLGYGFSTVVKNILLLNNKYRLQYDPSKPADYNPNALQQAGYDGTLTNGGNAIQ